MRSRRRLLLPRIRLHDLRHTSATIALERGVPLKVASERLGRSSTSITADIYQHVAEHMQSDAAEVLGDALVRPRCAVPFAKCLQTGSRGPLPRASPLCDTAPDLHL